MINRNKVLSVTLVAAMVMAFFPFVQSGHSQEVQVAPIHMAAVLANMQKTVDAKKAKPGEQFTLKTVSPATLNTGQVIPLGSILEGHVVSATPSEHHSDSTLVVMIDKLHLKGGEEIAVKAEIVKVSSLLPVFGGGDSHMDNQHFDRVSGSAAQSMPNQYGGMSATGSSKGPHPVKGLSVKSSVTSPDSGTITQEKRNVHLTNENQFEIQLAVVPKGVMLRGK